ncbi:MAG TPA: 2-oxoacid:acceptor oxidoreductase subunit alpha, partial [Dehalococcoidales bacterium]|nr:2-oxoacid:acceptor oxidoreductase subunit alpha [Dehalococcoidales bacterium]
MEDEIASMAAVLGGSWAGVKSMTSTSGPGFSLIMENIGLGVMMETPCVVVNIQRAGPSTGIPTMVGQGDIMQARWGSHGSYEIIAISPSSVQEIYDFTILAFNLSEKYRIPVLIMSDEAVGHMSEKLVIAEVKPGEIIERKKPAVGPDKYLPYKADDDLVPPMANAGEGYRFHTTGLTHDERGYPAMSAEAHSVLVTRLVNKIRQNRQDIIRVQEFQMEDADIVVVAYGITARIARLAIDQARAMGIKAGLLQLVTIWPFAEEKVRQLAKKTRAFVVPEINMGQIVYEVERCGAGVKTISVPNAGGAVHQPTVILDAILEAAK